MAEDEEIIHTLLLDDAEATFIHSLRDLDPDGEDPSSERIQKLANAGPVQLKVSVGERDLGHAFTVLATDLIFACANVGLEIQSTLLSQEWIDGEHAQVDHLSDAVDALSNDEMSSQLFDRKIADNETVSGEKLREQSIHGFYLPTLDTFSRR